MEEMKRILSQPTSIPRGIDYFPVRPQNPLQGIIGVIFDLIQKLVGLISILFGGSDRRTILPFPKEPSFPIALDTNSFPIQEKEEGKSKGVLDGFGKIINKGVHWLVNKATDWLGSFF